MEVASPASTGGDPVQDPTLAQPANTPVQADGALDATDQPTADVTPSNEAPDVQGTVSRMQQEVAKYKKVMSALNIDPDSDFADKFVAGLVGKEDVARALGVNPAQQVQQPTPAEANAHQRLADIINKVKTDGATEEDFTQGLSVVAEVLERIEQEKAQTTQQTVMQKCEAAVTGVISADEFHQKLPEDLRNLESELFLASTDYYLANEARKTANPQSFVNPQGYAFYAQKNAERLDNYRQHLINYGKSLAQAPKVPQKTQIQPMSPGGGGEPVLPTQPMINRNNLRKAAQAYLSQAGTI